jgi:hypothetical protein
MKTKIGLALCALAVAAPAWLVVRAGEPATAPTTGKVLVLDNERTLEGDIERQGEQYRVRHSVNGTFGGELWVQQENVLRLCATRFEAYQFLRSRANLLDPDEHVRLANWCHQHELRKEALDEVNAAVQLKPHNAATQRLLRSLQRTLVAKPVLVAGQPQDGPENNLNPPPVNTESLSGFVTRVQPLLMNACVSCHASSRGGAFKLTRIYEGALTGRRTTLHNLAAVMNQLNLDEPRLSPLLTKALSVHGDMAQPALKGRDAMAYKTLEEWVLKTVENNPDLRERPTTPSPVVAVQRPLVPEPTTKPEAGFATEAAAKTPGEKSMKVASAPVLHAEAKEVGTPSSMPAAPEPVDPFDPLIFNRQMHPQAKTVGNK